MTALSYSKATYLGFTKECTLPTQHMAFTSKQRPFNKRKKDNLGTPKMQTPMIQNALYQLSLWDSSPSLEPVTTITQGSGW